MQVNVELVFSRNPFKRLGNKDKSTLEKYLEYLDSLRERPSKRPVRVLGPLERRVPRKGL